VVGGPIGISVFGVVLSILMFLPQVAAVLRAPATTGVSPSAWWLVLTMSTLWGTYGLMIHEPVLVAPSTVMVPCAAVILWQIRPKRPANRRTDSRRQATVRLGTNPD
jgi:uncharacterized protein with PQ loop repeat